MCIVRRDIAECALIVLIFIFVQVVKERREERGVSPRKRASPVRERMKARGRELELKKQTFKAPCRLRYCTSCFNCVCTSHAALQSDCPGTKQEVQFTQCTGHFWSIVKKEGREEGRNCFVLASLTHSPSTSFYHFSRSLLFPPLTNVVPRQVKRTELSKESGGLAAFSLCLVAAGM